MTPRAFARIRDLTYRTAGLELREGKQQLVEARLTRLVRESAMQSFDELLDRLAADASGEVLAGLIDALTTNHTAFWREPAHFEFLRSRALPEWAGKPRINIWSAACASGEEPYTIAFCLLERRAQQRHSLRILATDISQRALRSARHGVYAADRVKSLPPGWINAFFEADSSDGRYGVKPEPRSLVEFRRANLIDPPPAGQRFDAVFCRNVMIYMDRAMQQRITAHLISSLEPGGYLFIGHAESLSAVSHNLTYVQPSVYLKGGDAGGRVRAWR
jgi:chemotaxis protein methyltransferase CheR